MRHVEGVVVTGDRRGRELGFPTANVAVDDPAASLPEDGVYAGRFQRADGSWHVAAISIGSRPTYYELGSRLLEAHLLDFDDDLYGEHVRVEVGQVVRRQLRFSSSEELVAQMKDDVRVVRELAAAGGLRGEDEDDREEAV